MKRNVRKVVALENLPRRAPVKTTVILILLDHTYNQPLWSRILTLVILVVVWALFLYDLFTSTEEPINLFDDADTNTVV